MSDLSNLLGDLYGGSQDPDGAPVRHEPAARDREEWVTGGVDDDLAEALSAALGEPAPAMTAAPKMPEIPVVQPQPAAPVAPAAAASPGSWTTAPAAAVREHGTALTAMSAPEPVVATVSSVAGPRLWSRGDDDILPMAGGVKTKKGK